MYSIAFFIPEIAYGGAERVFLNLALGIQKQSSEIYLTIFTYSIINKDLYFLFKKNKIKIIVLKKNKFIFNLFKIITLINTNKYSAVLSTIESMNTLLGFSRLFISRNTKVILREANTFGRIKLLKKNNFYRYFLKRFFSFFAYRFSDEIIANSNETKKQLSQYLFFNNSQKRKIIVIGNPYKSRILLLKNKISSNNSEKYFLSIGRLHYQKGFDILLEAMSLLKLKHNYILKIIGNGPEELKLKSLAKKLKLEKHVKFLGYKKNIALYLKNASALIIPSRWEGFGYITLESLESGTPIITTKKASGPSELIKNIPYCKIAKNLDSKSIYKLMNNYIKKQINIQDKQYLRTIYMPKLKKYNYLKIGREYLSVILR